MEPDASNVYLGLKRLDIEGLRVKAREVIAEIDSVLSQREKLRDELIKMGRDIIRLSGWAINALHRGRVSEAEQHLAEMKRLVSEFALRARSDSFIWHSGFVNNVLGEYVEASLFYSLVIEGKLLSHRELGVSEIQYLQGLGDTLGELRRLALDLLRQNDIEAAEKLLDLMEALYYEMRALEYPDALMPGVRHKVDVARRLIDDTKALLLSVKAKLACTGT